MVKILVMPQIMLNKHMKHIIYKTTHTNGKYYIGRHSTNNIDDGYLGSGKWPKSIKDKSTLTREILDYAVDDVHLKELEGIYLAEHFSKLNCMNRTSDPVGFNSANNPMKDPIVAQKISGDNHWLTKRPDYKNIIRERQNKLVEAGLHNLVGDKNPMKKKENREAVGARTQKRNLENNPSTRRAAQGIHHWQNGNSPNANGKINERRIAEGKHNFQGPDLNNKRIVEGTHNFTGSDSNLRRLAEGRHPSQIKKICEYCAKETSISMYTRWHGDNCKQKGDEHGKT